MKNITLNPKSEAKKKSYETPLKDETKRITESVCRLLGVSEEDVMGRSRTAPVSEARNIVWLFLNNKDKRFKPARIAHVFDRKHSTVIWGINNAKRWLMSDDVKNKAWVREVIVSHKEEILRGN